MYIYDYNNQNFETGLKFQLSILIQDIQGDFI